MRGHHELIEMRRNRKAPRMVFLNDYPCETTWFENPGDAVTICTTGDDLETIDLRFLVGLRVSVSSPSEKRAKRLFELCKGYVSAVAACHLQDVEPWQQKGWADVWVKPVKEVA
jgi:hypothetical protein